MSTLMQDMGLVDTSGMVYVFRSMHRTSSETIESRTYKRPDDAFTYMLKALSQIANDEFVAVPKREKLVRLVNKGSMLVHGTEDFILSIEQVESGQ